MQCQPLPKGQIESGELKLQPTEVLAVKEFSQGDKEVLIRWKDMPDFENTREFSEDIKLNFPEFHLEDKVVVQEAVFLETDFRKSLRCAREKSLGARWE